VAPGVQVQPSARSLTKFDLDFPGGTPKELISAIQKATDRPLNAIVPEEFASVSLPALKMRNVTVHQLFEALNAANRRPDTTRYLFMTKGDLTDDSIWAFYVERPQSSPMPKVCRFFPLALYLESGLTVDDITTAIETGWKMLGDTSSPTIRFHKDTKLLIAVGEPSKLEIIDAVLMALERQKPKSATLAAPASKAN
jgi:hypothetical protein